MSTPRGQHGLPNFRRAMGHVRPHARPLIIGLIAAVGVSVFYTFSVSSVIPVLKIFFAEHETLEDWLHRCEAERRLGIVVVADLPENPDGLLIADVRADSPNARVLRQGQRIFATAGERGSSYVLARRVAVHVGDTLADVGLRDAAGETRVQLHLRPHAWWWRPAQWSVAHLPRGRAPGDRFNTLLMVMTVIVLLGLAGGVCRFLNEGLVAVSVQRAMHDLRTRLADQTLHLPIDWHSTQPAGDTLSRFATDIDKVQVGIATLFGKVVREPLKAAGVLVMTVLIDWRMLVVALIGLPIGVLVIRAFGRVVKKSQRLASQSWGRLLDHLGERISGIRVVKACNMQDAEVACFEREGRALTRAQTHIELVDAASNPVLEVLATLAVAGFILYGGSRVFNKELDPQLLFGAVICMGGIFDPLRKMGNVNNRLQAAEASARRLFEIIDLKREEPRRAVIEGSERPALRPFRDEIEFRDVGFAYPADVGRLVLRGINLRVRKGQVVAIVGGNGSGKTTLVSLLLRFFEPTRGKILIDGQDIAGVSLESLRAQIGLVTQEAVIFSDTVRANIAYGANGIADAEAIERAARLAHIDDFVRSLRVEQNGHATFGYDAQINARTLSGGQRQRIVLARAILRDPPILILDEATSQVDTESEKKIQEALEDVTRNRTTFIIAHRFSTIARADTIVVLDAGRLVGMGTHAELLRTCPAYATLVRTQFAHGVA